MNKAAIAIASVMFIIAAFIVLIVWMTSPNRAQKPGVKKYNYKTKVLAPHTPFRLMTYNIGYASGLSNNKGGVVPQVEVIANLDKIASSMKEMTQISLRSRKLILIPAAHPALTSLNTWLRNLKCLMPPPSSTGTRNMSLTR